jgi:hypothetical protein
MKLKFTWNVRTTVGLTIGLLSPIIISPLTVFIIATLQKYEFAYLWGRFMHEMPIQSKIVSLSIIANLAWFYLFLNKERWDLARGIIIGSALYIPFIVYVTLIR